MSRGDSLTFNDNVCGIYGEWLSRNRDSLDSHNASIGLADL